ncbi:N-acetylmuramoyl-L-alanine amidase, partial [Clostridium celatum]|uniref:N-acetylmuramoyl-L-alanine amidase family protein n=1 Tax=Clostridium celatum TaxID=36834 RepID=UPI00319DCCD4
MIQTESFGRCAIWAPRDNDSSITSTPAYTNGGSSGGGGTGGTGKYLNLHPHMQSWSVYNENGPYTTANAIGSLSPAQFGGLSYEILAEKGGDVYIIQTESFGRCAIWAPADNDSSITSSPIYQNGDISGGGGTGGTGKYLNLHPHMQSWAVYNENGPYTTAYKIGDLAPAQFGGLSYEILAEKGGDVYVIQTESFGRCAIWAPRDNDSSITSTPTYTNGGSSGGGGTGGGNGGIEIPGGLKVFIDPGHGGSDPGASGNGLQEKNIVLSISKKIGVILNSYGISVKYSRETDTFVDLEPRAQQANSWGANLFVSIHANSSTASSASGTECYTKPAADAKTKQLSANVSKSISNKLGIPNRGHKEEVWRVLMASNMPAILVETAFISNSGDANLLKTRQDDFAKAIAIQICNYLGIDSPKPSYEQIVVSASEYEPLGGSLPGIPDRYKYNFIEPAINQLNDFKKNHPFDKITWLISSVGYSETDIYNFKDTAKKLGVNIKFFSHKSDLINYLNYDRAFYKIRNLTFFSHGLVGSVEIGYKQKVDFETNLSFKIEDIKNINSSGFSSNAFTMFYSCNTATEKNGTSFAKEWFNHKLGTVKAAVNKTSYYTLLGSTEKEKEEKLKERAQKGYSDNGS